MLSYNTINIMRKFFILAGLLVLTIIIQMVRPWGFIVPVTMVFITLMHQQRFSFKHILTVFFMVPIGLYILFFSRYSSNIISWYPIIIKMALARGIFSSILGPFNMLIGPGPVRPMFGHLYFWFYTISGNVATSIGALVWWFTLPFYFAIIQYKKLKEISLLQKYIGSFLIIFVVIYSLAYGGSVELRFRGILYILFSAQILSMYNIKLNSRICFKYLLFLLIIFLIGLIMGI